MGKSGISRMVLASVSLLIISLFNTFIEFFVSRGTLPYRPQSTSSTLMSLGDTPGIRLAWAIVSGSIFTSFWRASVERD